MTSNFSFVKENTLLSKELTESLLKRFDEIWDSTEYESSYPNVRVLTADAVSKEPLFASLLDEIYKKIGVVADVADLSFSKLWLVSSTSSDTDKNTLPYIPHFDKQRYFKAMVYLHDVTLGHGPIYFGEVKDCSSIERRRLELPADYKLKGLNSIHVEDLAEDLVPLLGNGGDVIFFDTNAAHKAGVVTEGYQRKILRFDFERPTFNSRPSIFKRVLNRIFISYKNSF
jgi:hypothetical protein